MLEIGDNAIKIEEFLQNLVIKIRNNELNHDQSAMIRDFFYSFHFSENRDKIEEKNILKYLTLGWYIYENLNVQNENNN